MAGTSCPTESPPASAALQAIIIDSEGDVLIELAAPSSLSRLTVSSSVLCNASSVFRAMLGSSSSFKEASELRRKSGEDSEPYKLTLEDDDPEALSIALNCLHHNNDKVPSDLAWDTLVAIAILTDKYDLREALRFATECWITRSRIPSVLAGNTEVTRSEESLFVTYVLERGKFFRYIARYWILFGTVSELDGPLDMECSATSMVPDSVIDLIRQKRKATISSILSICDTYMRLYTTAKKPLCKHGDIKCDYTVTGVMIRQFGMVGLLPFPKESVLEQMSANELVARLKKELKPVELQFCGNPSGRFSLCDPQDHGDSCGYWKELQDKVEQVIASVNKSELVSGWSGWN